MRGKYEREFQEAQEAFGLACEDQETASERSKEAGQLYESCLLFLREHGVDLRQKDHQVGDGEIIYTDSELKNAAAWGRDTDRMSSYTDPEANRPAKMFRRPSAVSKYISGQEEQR